MNISHFKPFSINLKGRLREFRRPQIMGILNITPDSFYAASRTMEHDEIARRVSVLLAEGADIIDIGAYSSRPGADDVSPEEEMRRLRTGLGIIRELSDDIPVSVDTFRASVARAAVEDYGADIINDISGGLLDPEMADVVAATGAPYILMHMRGTPSTMHTLTDYTPGGGITPSVIDELRDRVESLTQVGVADIIIDPGFGFAKTPGQNYRLFSDLPEIIRAFRRPVLVGVSRKSMIYRPLGITPAEALPGSLALAAAAIERGAAFLRVHDVGPTVQVMKTITQLTGCQ